MKDTIPNVLILGGGVAGMAAARSLNRQDLVIHLVEEQGHLGGKAALWACMATDQCRQCGACLSLETAQKVAAQDNVSLHLNTKLKTLTKTDQGVEASLNSGKTLRAAKVIMATGFSPFDPALIPSFHTPDLKKVITTAQLNTRLKEESLGDLLGDISNPRIAFIQCVGSRNRELKNDYCSQVCCKISLRHAQKLIHEIPGSQITLFYLDLQVIGKEIRHTLAQLSQHIDLVQGLPAEILGNSDTHTLTMVVEDSATLSRKTREFDLVVLSVGMEPSQTLNETAALLGASPNGWGFFNTDDARLADHLYIAGCAAGPKDILASCQEGRIAAAKVLKDLNLSPPVPMTLAVLGDGPQAAFVTKSLVGQGFSTYCFGHTLPPLAGATFLPQARILAIDGTAGNFSIFYEDQGRKNTLVCNALIAAPEPCITPHAGTTEFPKAMDLETFAGLDPNKCPDKAIILLDYFGPEFKSWARLALTAALVAQEAGKEITLVMNKMLVHQALGQQLYDRARRLGIRFLRFNTPEDLQIQTTEIGFDLRLKEATLPNLILDLDCHCLVLPPSLSAGPGFKGLAKTLDNGLDQEGFLQSPNVRHRLTQSPRKGIFFAGTGHDEVDTQDLAVEIQDIISSLKTGVGPGRDTGVEINEKKCAQCLTCYRICPHKAIILNEKRRPQIIPEACFSCHECVANCPAYAIESEKFTNDQIADQVDKDQTLIFACKRSAALAADKAAFPKNTRLISLPCACRISSDMILKALVKGAKKIIVSGCHPGNCRSMEGSRTARAEVARVSKMPGIVPGRVTWEPVAANETRKFLHMISRPQHKDNKNG